MKYVKNLLSVFILAAAVMIISSNSAFAGNYTVKLINETGSTITTVIVRPSGGGESDDIIAYMGNIRSGDEDYVQFFYSDDVKTFNYRALNNNGVTYSVVGVNPTRVNTIIIHRDGSFDLR